MEGILVGLVVEPAEQTSAWHWTDSPRSLDGNVT